MISKEELKELRKARIHRARARKKRAGLYYTGLRWSQITQQPTQSWKRIGCPCLYEWDGGDALIRQIHYCGQTHETGSEELYIQELDLIDIGTE